MKLRQSILSFVLVVIAISSMFFLLRGDQPKLTSDRERQRVESGIPSTKLAGNIPSYVIEVYEYIKLHQQAPEGYIGGRIFNNRERRLPVKTPDGNRIYYKEWDVRPHKKGVHRGSERLVTGDDEHAYYSSDHYNTFIPLNY